MPNRCGSSADFFTHTREAMVVCDLAGQVRKWNRAAEDLYGWSSDAIVGRDLDELLATRDAAGERVPAAAEFRGSVTRTCGRGHRLRLDLIRRVARDEALEPVLIDAGLLSPDADAAGDDYYGVIFRTMPIALFRIDGSRGQALALELSTIPEEERPAYLEAHPEKLEEMASLAFISETNQRGAELLGARSPEELRGLPILGVWAARMDTCRRSLVARLRDEIFEEETQVVAIDGRISDVLFVMAPVNHAGRRFTLVGMVDITDRRRAEAELARLQADFAHAARIATLGELTASLAHEVAQPLSAVLLSCETAQRWLAKPEPHVEEARSELGRAGGQARRAADVIARVRAMTAASISAKRIHDLNEIVGDALALVAPRAVAARVRLAYDPDAVPRPILADRVEIEQVIVNLVVNALQALEAGVGRERRIDVALGSVGDQVQCRIADTGPGVAEENVTRLFDRFFTTRSDGMGLGLAICRTIMETHGGSITAQNRTDRSGAVFSIAFPIATAETESLPG